MREEDEIKKRIMDRLDALPKIRIYCVICRKHCATISEEREMVHYDCWMKWRQEQKSQNPQ